jgi:hypothetical protein
MKSLQLLFVGAFFVASSLISAGAARAQEGDPPYFLETSTIVTGAGDAETDCNFNGTAVPCPDYLWFSAVGKLKTPGLAPVTVYLRNQHIQFTANSIAYDLLLPDAQTTFDPAAATATTVFSGGSWNTVVPAGASGNQFYSAFAWPVPCPDGFPGSVHPVAWTATFYANKPGVSVDWTWSAAAYTSFTTNYASMNVKATDDNHFSPNANSDHAGTPEDFKAFVTGGATGGGGSNYTGSLCSSHTVPDLPLPTRPVTWGKMKSTYR